MATAVAPAPKSARPKIQQTQCFIGGKWVPAASGKTFETINPATEEVIAEVAEGDAADIDLAVEAAREAFDDGPWSKMDARDRGRLMYKLADLIEEEADELAALETLDNGKPIRDAAGGRPAAGDRLPPLLRRLGRQDSRPDDSRPRQLLLLHAARAGRRRRADHSLELPDADGRLEVGPGPGRRLHDRDEAGRADAADLPADGAAGAEGRHSRRRDQRRARLRPDRRRRDRQASGRRQDRLHRRAQDGADHHARRRRDAEAADVRARRQEPEHRLRRRRPRRRRRRRALRPVLQPGPVLLRRQPAVRRGEGPRQVRRQARRR